MKRSIGIGTSMTEYVIILTMVALTAIGSLVLVGGGMGQMMAYMSGTMAGQGNGNGNQSAGIPKGSVQVASAQANTDNATSLVTGARQSSEDQVVDDVNALASRAVPDAAPVETSGGNGSAITRRSAQTVEQVAADYAQMPNADPQLAQYITDLANAGHTLSDKQYGLELDTARDKYLMLSGTAQKYYLPMWDSINQIRGIKTHIDKAVASRTAQRGYATPTPEMMAIINSAHAQIADSAMKYKVYANSVRSSGMATASGQQKFIQNYGDQVSLLRDAPQSDDTQNNSNTICAQGGKNCTQKGFSEN